MSYVIAQKIKAIRTERGMSQEEVAQGLNMTRQRYARIEADQVPITFKVIEDISKIFNVSTFEITKVSVEKKPLSILFREKQDLTVSEEVVEKIETILEYLSAHERLYFKMREGKDRGKL